MNILKTNKRKSAKQRKAFSKTLKLASLTCFLVIFSILVSIASGIVGTFASELTPFSDEGLDARVIPSATAVDEGNNVVFRVRVINRGPTNAENVTVTTQLANGLQFVETNASGAVVTGQEVVVNLLTIAFTGVPTVDFHEFTITAQGVEVGRAPTTATITQDGTEQMTYSTSVMVQPSFFWEGNVDGTRNPVLYEPMFTPADGTRFNAVTGEFITSAPWDLDDDFTYGPISVNITGAQTGIIDDALFMLDPSNNTAELMRLPRWGNAASNGNATNNWLVTEGFTVTIPATLEHDGVTYDVISLGTDLIGAQELTPTIASRTNRWDVIVIPEGVTHIQANAFRDHLARRFYLPSTLLYIGEEALSRRLPPFGGRRDTWLISPGGNALPEGLKEIGASFVSERNFGGGLTARRTILPFPESLEVVGTRTLINGGGIFGTSAGTSVPFCSVTGGGDVLTVPAAWTHIPPRFANLRSPNVHNSFVNISLHDGITHIHENAFNFGSASNPTNTSWHWPANLEYVGEALFEGFMFNSVEAATNFLNFPPTLTTIGNRAFHEIRFAGGPPIPLDFSPLENVTMLGFNPFSANDARTNWDTGFVWGPDTGASIPPTWNALPQNFFTSQGNVRDVVLDLSTTNIRYIGDGAFQHPSNWAPPWHEGIGFVGFLPPTTLEWLGNNAIRNQRNMRGDLIFHEGLLHIGFEALALLNPGTNVANYQTWAQGWDGVLCIPRSVVSFGHRNVNWPGPDPTVPHLAPLSRAWGGTNFSEIRHHRFVREMEGSLPDVDDRFDGIVDREWGESVLQISEEDPLLYKSARWTNTNLTEAEIKFQYGALIPWTLAFDLVFVLDYSSSMLDPVMAYYDGVDYWIPRWLVQQNLLQDAIDIFLNSQGYDNRVAVTTFGGGAGGTPATLVAPNAAQNATIRENTTVGHLWSSAEVDSNLDAGFSGDEAHVNNILRERPHLCSNQNTNYGVGLENAINMINARTDTSRQPVVIVIGDGEPWPILPSMANERLLPEVPWEPVPFDPEHQMFDPTHPNYPFHPDFPTGPIDPHRYQRAFNLMRRGTAHADWLRDQGIPLLPLGVFLSDGEGLIVAERARAALRDLSTNRDMLWDAENTEEFVDALLAIVQAAVTTMPPTIITDHLSSYFDLQFEEDNGEFEFFYTASAGTVTFDLAANPHTFSWDLSGEDTGIIHTLFVNVRLRSQYHTEPIGTGTLPTNSLTEEPRDDIYEEDSPELRRWIVTHEFVSGTPGRTLPSEIAEITPPNRGGYRNGATVAPTNTHPPYKIVNGERWVFVEWDKDDDVIDNDNVHFIGVWVVQSDESNLIISKTVTGALGNQNRDFGFTLTLLDENNLPLTGPFNYTITGAGVTTPQEGTIGSGGRFYLRHGQQIEIEGIPSTARAQVVEDANSNYNTTINMNGTELNAQYTVVHDFLPSLYNQWSTAGLSITANPDNSVTFVAPAGMTNPPDLILNNILVDVSPTMRFQVEADVGGHLLGFSPNFYQACADTPAPNAYRSLFGQFHGTGANDLFGHVGVADINLSGNVNPENGLMDSRDYNTTTGHFETGRIDVCLRALANSAIAAQDDIANATSANLATNGFDWQRPITLGKPGDVSQIVDATNRDLAPVGIRFTTLVPAENDITYTLYSLRVIEPELRQEDLKDTGLHTMIVDRQFDFINDRRPVAQTLADFEPNNWIMLLTASTALLSLAAIIFKLVRRKNPRRRSAK